MIENKKFSLIFIIFVLLPFGLIFFNNYLAENRINDWSYGNRWGFALFCYMIGVFGCIYIIVKNYRTKLNSKFWYGLSGVVGLLLFVLFYITSSFSHFGF